MSQIERVDRSDAVLAAVCEHECRGDISTEEQLEVVRSLLPVRDES